MAAVYEIQNRVNGSVYIGSTVQAPRARRKSHWSKLRRGQHHNLHLQRAWDKYGEDAFEFVPLLELDCSESEIRQHEEQAFDDAVARLGRDRVYTAVRGGLCPMLDPEVSERLKQNQQWRENVAASNRQQAQTAEWQEAHRAGIVTALAKHYTFLSPSGEPTEIYNLAEFCRGYDLRQQHMVAVFNGKREQHKGWRRLP